MQEGWISIHRKILDWEWYGDVNVCRFFIHCLLKANHKDCKWRGVELNRGQFISSVDTMARETMLSTSQIKTCIKKLKSTNEIANESQTQFTVFTVVKYDDYQASDKHNDKPVTNESQTNDKRMTTDNNVNNVNNETMKQKDSSQGKTCNSEKDERFEKFWVLYGRKGNKASAKNVFMKLSEAKLAEIGRVVLRYVESTPDKQWRLDAEKYLNPSKEHWNDEIVNRASASKQEPQQVLFTTATRY